MSIKAPLYIIDVTLKRAFKYDAVFTEKCIKHAVDGWMALSL